MSEAADSCLSLHSASGFIDLEEERVCSYKQHTGALLKHTLQTLCTNQRLKVWQDEMHLRLGRTERCDSLMTCLSKCKHTEGIFVLFCSFSPKTLRN